MWKAWRACSRHSRGISPGVYWLRALAWAVAAITFANAFCFVLHSANPVIRSDDWYSLDIFVRKAAEGRLGIVDFFARRYDADHAQPLNKLVMLLEWRWFDLDFAVASVIGVVAAAVCAAILHRVLLPPSRDPQDDGCRHLAWAVMCAVLFSLNSSGVWTWPLVALGYLAIVPILLFLLVVWRAHQGQRHGVLALATVLLGAVADDSVVIVVMSVTVALLLVVRREPSSTRVAIWKVVAVILTCMVLTRLGYALVPVWDTTTTSPSLATSLVALSGRLGEGAAWKWIMLPLSLSVASENPFHGLSAPAWGTVQTIVAMFLLAAHALFWWRALRGRYNEPMFVAVCMMLLAYGWLAAIIVVRVALFGGDYVGQPRYVLVYQLNLIALLLMWAGAPRLKRPGSSWRNWLTVRAPMAGCVLSLLLQIPLAQAAWQHTRYSLPYYGRMAVQIGQLAKDPTQTQGCLPELVVCHWPLDRRRAALDLLRSQRLNVFSSRVQGWHRFLPPQPTDAGAQAP